MRPVDSVFEMMYYSVVSTKVVETKAGAGR